MMVSAFGGSGFSRALICLLRKRLVLMLPLAVIGFTACDSAFGINLQAYSVRSEDFESASMRTASFRYMDDSIGYWKSPREFENDGGGNCEDFATYLMYLLGEKSSMYVVNLSCIIIITYKDAKFVFTDPLSISREDSTEKGVRRQIIGQEGN